MSRAKSDGEPTDRRESIWSIPVSWRVAYFALFSILHLLATCVIVWYEIENRGDSHPVEVLLSIAEGVSVTGLALAVTTVAIMEGIQLPMVLANYIRVKLVEPAKERLREQGRSTANAAWREWNARRMKAEEEGTPFDEPPPELG